MENNEDLLPPVLGWTYADGKGKWLSDSTLVCSREVSTACKEVVVHLEGGAKKKHPKLAGRYLPLEGRINRGRWVGSLSTNTHLRHNNCHCVTYEN